MKEREEQPSPYSVRLPAEMRRKLDSLAKEGNRSLHAEILLRLGESISSGSIAAGALSTSQEDRIRQIIQEELAKKSR